MRALALDLLSIVLPTDFDSCDYRMGLWHASSACFRAPTACTVCERVTNVAQVHAGAAGCVLPGEGRSVRLCRFHHGLRR